MIFHENAATHPQGICAPADINQEKLTGFLISPHRKTSIYKVLQIENAEDAHAILERGENVGKVVLKVAEEE